MGALATLSFTAPLVLGALLALPVIWWLLRVTPPAPRRLHFFGLRFLLGLRTEEETPDKTPLWLLILRLAAAALIVLALAGPVLNAMQVLTAGDDVLVVVVDDDWAAAHRWDERRSEAAAAIEEARRSDTPVILAPTTAPDFDIRIEDSADALARMMALEPQPLGPDRLATLRKVEAALNGKHARIIWLADGLGGPGTDAVLKGLAAVGSLDVFMDDLAVAAIGILPPGQDSQGMLVPLIRADAGPALNGSVQAYGDNGRYIAGGTFAFRAGEKATTARIEVPTTLRNDIERIAIENRASAGAVTLLDERQRRRPVGIVSGDDGNSGQPLLSQTYYVERALENAAEARVGSIGSHLESGVSMLILADVGQVVGAEHDQLAEWISKGGVLVRFAGPRLAASHDDLLPVELRQAGARALGGSLSWEKPQGLGPFPKDSPFLGLAVPDDVAITRQVLAEPSLELEGRTWASLADGTPLVTAEKRGEGWIVLFHITANADWSNLPMTGLFVDMLKRMITLGRGVGPSDATAEATGTGTLNPRLMLDGFGRLVKPTPAVTPIPRSGATASREHPPGLYGEGQATVAVNLFEADATLAPFPDLPQGAAAQLYGKRTQVDLKPWLLGLALLLLFADAIASLLLRGYRLGFRRPAAIGAAIALACALIALPAPDALAQDERYTQAPPSTGNPADDFALQAVLQTRLAYIKTGDGDLDNTSREGLEGLTRVLNMRTAIAAGEPLGVDPETDELAFFPLIYWPIPDDGAMPSDKAIARIDTYMKNGGTVLFDTRDGAQGGPASAALQSILKKLDLPPLQRVPREHVLTKAFYLLSVFPGRNADGDVWVEASQRADGEATSEAQGDGVSSVVIGAGDWAAAWAADEYMRPLYAMGPGGERQREYAYRFGVNLAMYALTGNYKADQVHVPALLERMGQ